jgi:cell shape-determining protein MreD
VNWVVFGVCAWVCFGLNLGLAPLISQVTDDLAPSFVVPLLVFVGLFAPGRTVIWAGLALGLIADLTTPIPRADAAAAAQVLGPQALGMAGAGALVVWSRELVIARNPITHVVLSGLAALVVHLVICGVFTARSAYDPGVAWQVWHEVRVRAGASLYTAVAAIPVSLVLFGLHTWFEFPQGVGASVRGGRAFRRERASF